MFLCTLLSLLKNSNQKHHWCGWCGDVAGPRVGPRLSADKPRVSVECRAPGGHTGAGRGYSSNLPSFPRTYNNVHK